MDKKNATNIIRWVLVITAAIVIFFTGRFMLKEEFWGYAPLYFFISCWYLIVALIFPVFSKHPKKLKLLAMSSLAGFIFFLGFPTKPVTLFMFVGFIPLLYVEDQIYKWRDSISRWEVFKYSFHALITWNILSTFWVANTSFVPSIAAFTLNSFFMAIPLIGYHFIRKRLGERYRYISLVVFWLCFEWIHLQWEISWPWLTLGNSFAHYPFVVQWYEYTGHLGGSLWILLMNIFLYKFIIKLQTKVELKVDDLMYPVFTLFGPILISVMIYVTYQEKGELRNISIVQPNYEPHYEKFNVPEKLQIDRFVRLSEECLTDSTDYLLYPETIFGYFDIDNLNREIPIQRLKNVVKGNPRTNIVSGLSTLKYYSGTDELSNATRKIERRDGTISYLEVQNSAVQFNANNLDEYEVHIKSKLVPGAEIFPFRKILFFLEPIVRMAGGSVEGHGRTKEREVFSNDFGEKIAPVICYESVYGEYVGSYIKKGANAIFIMTNDGWWDKTPGHIQHLNFARLRAVEHRRSIARSANTGISAFIDQKGNIIDKTKYGKEATLQGSIRFNKEITFYSKWGDIIARIAILGSILLIISGILKRFRKE
jgi:apolipoprotein N-acyltransferase